MSRDPLSKTHPRLAKEWHPTRNKGVTPRDVTRGSGLEVWWKCRMGSDHVWKTKVRARAISGNGCPYCSGRIASSNRNLLTWCHKNGEFGKRLIREFVHQENAEPMSAYTPGGKMPIKWRCEECDEIWSSAANYRTSNRIGCPYCRGMRVGSKNNLAVRFPLIAREWHPDNNGSLRPSDVVPGSSRKVWWRCKKAKDHEWQATPASRTSPSAGRGCPFCRGLKVAPSNCLSTTHPAIAKEWHQSKNKNVNASSVTSGSNKKVWWQCPEVKSHVYDMPIVNRTGQGQGCPFCVGRRVDRTNSLEAVYPKIARQWHPTKNRDLTAASVTAGSNRRIWWKCGNGPDHEWQSTINARRGEDSCPFCPPRILKLPVTNSLATWCKQHGGFGLEVLSQWDTKKNKKLKPSQVIYLAQRVSIHWQCSVAPDHQWSASPYERTIKRQTCPFCKRRKTSSTNNLAGRFPNLLPWIHPKKTPGLDPSAISPLHHVPIWWKCPEGPDHEFLASPNAMQGENRCGFCDGKRVSVTNSLETQFPDIAREFDVSRNQPLTPKSVTYATGKKVWWRCSINPKHRWRAVVSNRTTGGQGCPHCVMAPRSRREIFLATELAHLYQAELGDHKIISTGRILDADIIIRSHKLVVEYDGSYWHQNKIQKDKEKVTKLRALGWRVIRIREAPLVRLQKHDVTTTDREPLHEVAAKVLEAAETLGIRAMQSSTKYRRLGRLITADIAEKRVRELLKTPQSAAARSANERWNAFFNELIAFGKQHKHYEPSVIAGDSVQKLRRWVRAQRTEYQSGRLSVQRVVALEGLDGWNWEQYDSLWEKKFSQLQAHSESTKSVHVRQSNDPNKESLRHWVINQRILKHRNRLAPSRVTRLESLPGWSWTPLDKQWQDAFQLLLQFVARHGTSDVKQNHIEDGFKLGIWLNKQRGRYRRGNLPQDRIQLLESQPDWKWEPRQDRTSTALAALHAFTARTGHSKVPIRHVEDGLKLGQFVYNVRGRYARRELSASLKTQLESIPNWSWNR